MAQRSLHAIKTYLTSRDQILFWQLPLIQGKSVIRDSMQAQMVQSATHTRINNTLEGPLWCMHRIQQLQRKDIAQAVNDLPPGFLSRLSCLACDCVGDIPDSDVLDTEDPCTTESALTLVTLQLLLEDAMWQ